MGNDQLSFEYLAEEFRVSKTTLQVHCLAAENGERFAPPGVSTLLTRAEEQALIVWMIFLSTIRFPASKAMILRKAKEIAHLVTLVFVSRPCVQRITAQF